MSVENAFIGIWVGSFIIITLKQIIDNKSIDFLKTSEMIIILIYSAVTALGFIFSLSLGIYGTLQEFTLMLSKNSLNIAIIMSSGVLFLFSLLSVFNYPEGIKIKPQSTERRTTELFQNEQWLNMTLNELRGNIDYCNSLINSEQNHRQSRSISFPLFKKNLAIQINQVSHNFTAEFQANILRYINKIDDLNHTKERLRDSFEVGNWREGNFDGYYNSLRQGLILFQEIEHQINQQIQVQTQ